MNENIMNKITVKEFINKYNALSNEKLKEDYIRTIIKDTYVQFENKVAICEKIVESSYYIKTNYDGVERKKLYINSPAKYMLHRLNIIDNYTIIKIDFKNSLEEYNMLNKYGIIDFVFDYVSSNEIGEFNMILDMIENDAIKNEYEIHSFIASQVERFSNLFGHLIEPGLKQFTSVIENIDDKTIDKLLTGIKSVANKSALFKEK